MENNLFFRDRDMNAKVISLFNHKGGVSKTTTAFHLGWTMAEKGLKVLIVDADPQCNLTGYALGLGDDEDLFSFYEKKTNDDIYNAIKPLFKGINMTITGATPSKTKHENLFLLAGNLELAEIDTQLAAGLATGDYFIFAKQFIGAFNALIRLTAQKGDFDIVIIDMSPSISALNRCLIMGSDYFIIPTSPDFYCYQAIQSLSKLLPAWEKEFRDFRDSSITNSLPKSSPQMLGVISQNYRPRKTSLKKTDITRAFQKWIDKIKNTTNQELVPALEKVNMIIDRNIFLEYCKHDTPYNLVNIPTFNTLIAVAQDCNKPVFALTDKEINLTGNSLENTQENREKFKNLFYELTDSILQMIGFKKKDS